MSEHVVIDPRFNGPATSGHGGYVAGLLARAVDGPAEVTLRRPPPLGVPLRLARAEDGSVALTDDSGLIGEARAAGAEPVAVPEPPELELAAKCGEASPLRSAARHPFPTCFACGCGREPGDGLRIIPGPVPGTDLVADVWTPAPDLAGADGAVTPEFVWAALDCPSGLAAMLLDGLPSMLLGRMSSWLLAPVPAGEPVVCAGWLSGHEGRKYFGGSALYSADGTLLAHSSALWIAPRT
ncbi:hypothetical protein ORV05_17730 [Amycolatopsis cynarae]|uniref:Thioesterase family protein n=1 Tax=Amycolatopsis cynarae TaxID=2995223 RepID=A0ABY7BG08_9PSEU|nr:hypothetical protein [Amycolatopsis sp. HUAS 11-8]WAL69533.1 hypothetical protein ORV05_17730 [Amycolatopsis sp. HUAS 11-8]